MNYLTKAAAAVATAVASFASGAAPISQPLGLLQQLPDTTFGFPPGITVDYDSTTNLMQIDAVQPPNFQYFYDSTSEAFLGTLDIDLTLTTDVDGNAALSTGTLTLTNDGFPGPGGPGTGLSSGPLGFIPKGVILEATAVDMGYELTGSGPSTTLDTIELVFEVDFINNGASPYFYPGVGDGDQLSMIVTVSGNDFDGQDGFNADFDNAGTGVADLFVPEPTTAALLGCLGAGLMSRRSRRDVA